MKKLKAKVEYSNGWMLIIPKISHAPLLFLEWLSSKGAASNVVHVVLDDTDVLKIRLNLTKLFYIEALDYINNNL